MHTTNFTSLSLMVVCAMAGQVLAGCSARSDGGREDIHRIPQRHRVASLACPEERGIGNVSPDGGVGFVPDYCTNNAGGTSLECLQDSDCANGTRGRCLAGHFACTTYCSYDICSTDADCDKAVCECRRQGSDNTPNSCWGGGNCLVDADCGPGGYCSPSQVATSCLVADGSCGQGYFCRTPNDTCVDDADCGQLKSGWGPVCVYEVTNSRWACHDCFVGF